MNEDIRIVDIDEYKRELCEVGKEFKLACTAWFVYNNCQVYVTYPSDGYYPELMFVEFYNNKENEARILTLDKTIRVPKKITHVLHHTIKEAINLKYSF